MRSASHLQSLAAQLPYPHSQAAKVMEEIVGETTQSLSDSDLVNEASRRLAQGGKA